MHACLCRKYNGETYINGKCKWHLPLGREVSGIFNFFLITCILIFVHWNVLYICNFCSKKRNVQSEKIVKTIKEVACANQVTRWIATPILFVDTAIKMSEDCYFVITEIFFFFFPEGLAP